MHARSIVDAILGEEDTSEKIMAEYARLRSLSLSSLIQIHNRSHRVASYKNVDKATIVSDILVAKYGEKKVDAAFAQS